MSHRKFLTNLFMLVVIVLTLLPINGSISASVAQGAIDIPIQQQDGSAAPTAEESIGSQTHPLEIPPEMVDGSQVQASSSLELNTTATTAPFFRQQSYFTPTPNYGLKRFAGAIAISGNTLVGGAKYDSSAATGINGDPIERNPGNYSYHSGAAYAVVYDGNHWVEQTYLKASNTGPDHLFGAAVAIDGDTIVVGAPNERGIAPQAGAVYVFVRNGSSWSQQAYLKAANAGAADYFGSSVAISGNTIIVGAPGEASNATGIDGNGNNNSYVNAGAAYVFVRTGNSWSQQAYLKAANSGAGDRFGSDVAIRGDTVVIGAPFEDISGTGTNGDQGAAYIFARNGSSWSQQVHLKPVNAMTDQKFGSKIAFSADTLAVMDAQSIYVYIDSNGSWQRQAILNPPAPGAFGAAVALSGDQLVAGSALLYIRTNGIWKLHTTLKPDIFRISYTYFGGSLALAPHLLIVGSPGDGGAEQGAIYTFVDSPAPRPTCAGLVQEAESSNALISGFDIGSDTAASGGQYVGTPPAWHYGEYFPLSPDPASSAQYCFPVATHGVYRIKAKVYTDKGPFAATPDLMDSLYVRVDDAPAEGYLWDVLQNTTYATDYVSNRGVADPLEIELDTGEHIVTFYVRERGVRLDTIELELVAPTPTPTCAGLRQEAETGARSGNVVIGTDSAASNGEYVFAVDGTGEFYGKASLLHKVTYCFNVATSGLYRIKTKVFATSGNDSFYVAIDDVPEKATIWDLLLNTTYAEDYVNARGQAFSDPLEFDLNAGTHIVSVYVRADGARLDAIELELINPTAAAPTCAGLVQEAEDGALSGHFIIKDDSNASGGKFLSVSGQAAYPQGINNTHRAEYCFDVPIDGIYWLRAFLAGGETSLYAKVNGLPVNGYMWPLTYDTYLFDGTIGDIPINLPMRAGANLVTLYQRSTVGLDKLSLELISPFTPATCSASAQEAEDGVLSSGFSVGSDPAASGGKYVVTSGIISAENIDRGKYFKADYCFTVPVNGIYRIKGKVYAPSSASDSFYVKIDGPDTAYHIWDVLPNSTYALDYVNARGVADPLEVELSAGEHLVSIYLREGGTRLDTLEMELVSATPPAVSCTGLTQEAENGAIYGGFVLGNDAAASAGKYIEVPEGSGSHYNGAILFQRVDYCFKIATAGTYRIKGNVYGADTLSDSFYVKVDNAPANGYLWDVATNSSYATDFANDRGVADPLLISLSAGNHIVSVYVREDGTRLDTIGLELAYTTPPPPTCGGLTQEAENGALDGYFTIGNDPAASGGKYIHVPKGTGTFWNGPTKPHKAQYCFNASNRMYRIDANVYGADDLSNSFYVQVESSPTSYLWDTITNTTYLLDSVNDRNKAYPVYIYVQSVPVYISIYAREDGARLDTISLVPVTTAAQSRAIPPLAQGIHGTLRINATGLTQEIDFTQITVALVDAESKGQSFSQQVQADRFGRFHFDGMMPGQYVVRLVLPDGFTASASEVTVTATAEEASDASFDLAVQPVQEEGGNKTYLPLINR